MSDAYLYVPGVPGEDDGWIRLTSYSVGGGWGDAGAKDKTLRITKRIDRASNGLMAACLSGKTFGAIVLWWAPDGSRSMETTFTFAAVASIQDNYDTEYASFAYETKSTKYDG